MVARCCLPACAEVGGRLLPFVGRHVCCFLQAAHDDGVDDDAHDDGVDDDAHAPCTTLCHTLYVKRLARAYI